MVISTVDLSKVITLLGTIKHFTKENSTVVYSVGVKYSGWLGKDSLYFSWWSLELYLVPQK